VAVTISGCATGETLMICGRLLLTIVTSALVAAVLPSAVTSASASTAPAGAAAASVAVTPQQAGIAAMMKSYSADKIGPGWWQAAISLSTLETYEQATGDTTYYQDIADTYNAYKDAHRGDYTNDYADDTGWWGLAWLQAYNVTGNIAYLQTAEYDADYIHGYWDTTGGCGPKGGVWWLVHGKGAPSGRVTIPNALFLQLTAGLHNAIPGDTKYLGWARSTWSWLDSGGLISGSGLVYNGWNGACALSGPYWTYNQGAVIAGLATLYQATGNASLISVAEKIAGAAIATLAPRGVLADPCEHSASRCENDGVSFKGIFVRDLKILARVAGTSRYNSFFAAQAASIEAHDTNAAGQSGLIWSGPLSTCSYTKTAVNPCNVYTQASADDALVAAFTLPARPAAVVNQDGAVRVFARAAGGGAAGGGLEQDSLAPGSLKWSGFSGLGGATPYGPAAVSAANGDTWVFATGADGALYADRLPTGSRAWSGWSSLGKPGPMHLLGTPAVVQDHTGAIRVFARGVNGNLYTDSLSGSRWSGFSDLAGTWPSDVAATVAGGGSVDVYAVGTNGNLFHNVLDPGRRWSGWVNLGGSVTGVPAALADTPRVYARSVPSGALEEYQELPGTTRFAEDSRGGSWPDDPAAVAGGGAHEALLFEIGTSGSLDWQYLTKASAWSPWLGLGGSFTGVPAAVHLGNGATDLFADSGGTLEEDRLAAGAGTWSGWSALGGHV
jgi:predicted alpha-1,6-mannanase (GH76 family)